MSEVVIIGGGIAGLGGAMLLARDGHHVTVLERDAASPGPPIDAWSTWERRGVNQFRLAHAFLPRFRQILDAELPDVVDALVADGARRTNRIEEMPIAVTGGWRAGDERFEAVTGRRPMIEASIARLAAREPGVDIRRGVAIRSLLAADHNVGSCPHVVGVITDEGEQLLADLVVDASGRRSCLPDMLAAIGARRPIEEAADSGFLYYSRHFRAADGQMPPMLGPPLQHYDSISTLTAVADHGHWAVVLVASARDAMMRRAGQTDVWHRVIATYPLIAHWADAEPVTGIDVMAKIEDRVRHFAVDGRPVATGVVAVGDAAACTNPSAGRGASMALLHVTCLRDVIRKVGTDDPHELIRCWNETTENVVAPFLRDTLAFDHHRLAQIEAQIRGVPYETADPAWKFGQALGAFAARDPDVLRGAMDVVTMLDRGVHVAQRPGLADKLRSFGEITPLPGPGRAELEAIVSA